MICFCIDNSDVKHQNKYEIHGNNTTTYYTTIINYINGTKPNHLFYSQNPGPMF